MWRERLQGGIAVPKSTKPRLLQQDIQIGAAPGIVVNLIGGNQIAQPGKLGGNEAVRGWLIRIGWQPPTRTYANTLLGGAGILQACLG